VLTGTKQGDLLLGATAIPSPVRVLNEYLERLTIRKALRDYQMWYAGRRCGFDLRFGGLDSMC
jgi:hypothetical protein